MSDVDTRRTIEALDARVRELEARLARLPARFANGGGGSSVYLMRVTQALTGGSDVQAKLFDGASESGDAVQVRASMGHAVGDVIYATPVVPHAGTPGVPWLEVLRLEPSVTKYRVVQVLDDVGRLGVNSARFE